MEESLRRFGAGRSILVDRRGRIIAGNTTTEAAVDIGLDDCIVVPTDRRKLVVVQRTDLDLKTDPAARALAVADNRTSDVRLSWDPDVLRALTADVDVNVAAFFSPVELADLLGADAPVPRFEPEAPAHRLDELAPDTTCPPVAIRGDRGDR